MNQPAKPYAAEAPFQPTEWQRTAAASYQNGEHAWVLEAKTQRVFGQNLSDCGDGLFRFIMKELGPLEATNIDEAIRHMTKAQSQIGDVLTALEHGPSPKPGV